MRIASTICTAAIALSLSGCYLSQTHISTTDGRSYKIYGNGELLCEDSQDCKIGQRGTPNTLELEAVKGGQVVGRTTITRQITTASILWMFYTCYTSLYFYQAYPDNVYIPLDYSRADLIKDSQTSSDGWGSATDWNTSPYKSSGSVWDNGAEPADEPSNTTRTNANYDGPAADEY